MNQEKKTRDAYLGIELGSTRIKAVLMDGRFAPIASAGYTWASRYENGIWTYDLALVWEGLSRVLAELKVPEGTVIRSAGVSAMMHGYLAFDKDWNLLVPFRTWQNTTTRQASEALTELLHSNIPQRWSVAHLYQALLNGEEHVPQVAHLTTLAGYVHFLLTGENVLCVDDASGMFPINPAGTDYDETMLEKTQKLLDEYHMPWKLRELLPGVLPAGVPAGKLTREGAARLGNTLEPGVPFAPPAGDGGTGMVATNSVAVHTGNVSAGTSIFADIVLEKPLKGLYPEIDNVTTPTGRPVAEIHCNNCTNDMNVWVSMLGETARLFGANLDTNELYTRLYQKSLEADPDCGGVVSVNYLAGECITHLDQGFPLVLRSPDSRMNLANFLRAQLYATFATLRIGFDLLAQENVTIENLMGHGGVFKTPGVGQRYLAAACEVPVTCLTTAGEGGPYGMALLAAFMILRQEGESLEAFLQNRVFADAASTTCQPLPEDVAGYRRFLSRFTSCLELERVLDEKA